MLVNELKEILMRMALPQVKPYPAGLGFGKVTQREYRRDGPYFVLPFCSSSFFRIVWRNQRLSTI